MVPVGKRRLTAFFGGCFVFIIFAVFKADPAIATAFGLFGGAYFGAAFAEEWKQNKKS